MKVFTTKVKYIIQTNESTETHSRPNNNNNSFVSRGSAVALLNTEDVGLHRSRHIKTVKYSKQQYNSLLLSFRNYEKKFAKNLSVQGSKSFKVIDVDKTKKLV